LRITIFVSYTGFLHVYLMLCGRLALVIKAYALASSISYLVCEKKKKKKKRLVR
jgi:hypothetical protein